MLRELMGMTEQAEQVSRTAQKTENSWPLRHVLVLLTATR